MGYRTTFVRYCLKSRKERLMKKVDKIVIFEPMDHQHLPEDLEACLLITKSGYIAAGCWISNSSGEGFFSQGCNGVYKMQDVAFWATLEHIKLQPEEKLTFSFPEN